jgi:hypothetical protein
MIKFCMIPSCDDPETIVAFRIAKACHRHATGRVTGGVTRGEG